MGKAKGLISYLDEKEMELLHEGALSVLEKTGVRIDHLKARAYLTDYGCVSDENTHIVKFPAAVTQKCVDKMRADYASGERSAVPPMRYTEMYLSTVPKGIKHGFTVNAGGFPPYIIDLGGKRREADINDVTDSVRLADALDNIDLIGLPCSAFEIPYEMRPVAMAAELVKNTAKPGGIEAWTVKDVKYINEIAEVVRGSREELRRRPFLIGYGEIKSPLTLDYNMCEIFIEYVRLGFPQSLDTMPCGGTTAPASGAGVLAQGLAETLAGLVLGYSIDGDAWVSIDMTPGFADMQTMLFPYAGADRIPLTAAANQMMREYYGRPGGCHAGKTDACFPGAQAGFEKALSAVFPILCGATGIGTLGQLEGGVAFSPVQLVIDNEIVGYIKRALAGFDVTEETLALDVINETGPGGNFIEHEHTAANFRKEFYFSEILEKMPRALWESRELKGVEELAAEKAKKIIREQRPKPLNEYQEKEIGNIVKRAYKDILGA